MASMYTKAAALGVQHHLPNLYETQEVSGWSWNIYATNMVSDLRDNYCVLNVPLPLNQALAVPTYACVLPLAAPQSLPLASR
jgi:hypothetical protein